MSKTNENKLVPKLRFPEFKNIGEWVNKRLDEICKFVRGPFGGALKKEIFTSDGYAVYEQSHAIYADFSSFRYFITEEKYNELKRFAVQPNDIIMSCSGTMGKFAIVPVYSKKGVINQALLKLTVNTRNDTQFIKASLELPLNQNKLLSQSAGGAIKNVVEVAQIKKINLLIPTLPEQQKIASCLSSLDEVITAESQKLELYQQHKKGLLQNLFPQEGETVPKLRFKNFEDSGEWKSDIAKNVFSIFQGFAFSSNDSVDNGVRWLKIADVGIQQINHQSPSNLPIEFKEKYKDFLVKEGDYVIALTRPILNKKLKISKVDNILNESLLNQRVGKLISNECIDFVYYLLQTSKLISTIEQNIAGSEPPNLSTQQIENIEVCIPSTIEEQQKIASCLSSLDDLINAQRQKIELLKQHKKGLLQGLFPPINN